MQRWMVFCEIIDLIGLTLSPVDAEESLRELVTEPVPAHVPGFGTALFDIFCHKAVCSGVVGLEGNGVLFVTKVLECKTDDKASLCIAKNATCFCFSSGSNNVLDGFAFNQYGTI